MPDVEGTRLPTAADVDRAAGLLGSVIPPTPLQRADRLSALTGLDVWLKREDLTPVRSYKARGAYTVLAGLTDEERSRGVTCASAGNHAQGVAFACARAGVRATIFLPRVTPRQKRDRVAALGGDMVEVVIAGEAYDDAAVAAADFAAASGATSIPAFDHPGIIAGQGTVAAEILDQSAALGWQPDALVLPVGGAGLIAGCLTVLAERLPGVCVVAAEPSGAASLAAALQSGGPVELASVDPFVDGASVRRVGDLTYAAVAGARSSVSLSLASVPEGLICVEMLDLYQADGIIAEPAGALAASALRLDEVRAHLAPGSRVVVVVSGGNNDVSRYADIVERALVFEGLKHYFLIEFPQEPGALRRFLDDVLGPDDDITLFEYTKRNNRETGPALVGVEMRHRDDLAGLLARMEASRLTVEKVPPNSPLFGLLLS
ncbi:MULTISPECIES: threonine ammonia-lyase IlvA [unclassified Nocardioides]|uniref:threonine ammonia-lyase IlvA n=1 Tax=unclassified Nocardioides TaxID=2615069 RepID=UPI0007027494|nr:MULTISPECIES: threonine ammonia-lyase IlvA [unclassified Nocardioides]KRC52819.1 threonine dehydratase [Nocardioides sp. Root79]KRC72350.1 threonine dehydratase [Nocardioides sp. Root240]